MDRGLCYARLVGLSVLLYKMMNSRLEIGFVVSGCLLLFYRHTGSFRELQRNVARVICEHGFGNSKGSCAKHRGDYNNQSQGNTQITPYILCKKIFRSPNAESFGDQYYRTHSLVLSAQSYYPASYPTPGGKTRR